MKAQTTFLFSMRDNSIQFIYIAQQMSSSMIQSNSSQLELNSLQSYSNQIQLIEFIHVEPIQKQYPR